MPYTIFLGLEKVVLEGVGVDGVDGDVVDVEESM